MEDPGIAFINTTRFWGGGEKWHLSAAKYFNQKDYRVYGVAWPDSPFCKRMKESGIEVLELKVRSLSYLNPLKISRLKKFLVSKGINTVIMNGSADLKIGAKAGFKAGIENIVYRRGMGVKPGNHVVNRKIFSKYLTHLISNSRENIRVMEELISYGESEGNALKVLVNYNGIELDESAQKRFHPIRTDRKITLGTTGRLVYQKGHEYLIDVANELKNQGLSFEIIIAGEGPDRPKLEAMIDKAKLKNKIRLPGFTSDVYAFLKSLDLFIFPSRWEGLSNALAEAMWCGLPVVAFDTSSNSELINDGKNGFLVKPFDTHSMAEKVIELINDPALQKRFIENGRKKVIHNYDKQSKLAELESFLFPTIKN